MKEKGRELRIEDIRLMSGITGGVACVDGRDMKEVVMIEIDNPYIYRHGG